MLDEPWKPHFGFIGEERFGRDGENLCDSYQQVEIIVP